MIDPIADIINTAYNRGLHAEALGAPILAKLIRQQIGRELLEQIDMLLKGNPNGLINYGIGMSKPAIRHVCQLEKDNE